MKKDGQISIVVPIMNEEGNLPLLTERIKKTVQGQWEFEILFVDDGSTDNTLRVLKEINEQDDRIKYLSFSRNFGHQIALKAGIDNACGDCVISMDGDLQHPPELIPKLIGRWEEGYEVVYTLRKDDKKVGTFKRITSGFFYRLMNWISDISFEPGVADFRLIDRRVADVIKSLNENPIFFRGMIKWIGYKQIGVEYYPEERTWGKTKYSFAKMFKFALIGITSFSIKPLRLASLIGTLVAVFAFLYGTYAIILKIFTEQTVPGWTSSLIVMSLLGGIQLIMIGIIGEYLGKLFIESKRRPEYLIRERSI